MATDQQFCLRWNNHQSTLISVFDSLLENGTLVDCTLAAEGQYLKAHKVVLSACSPYLELLLSQHYEKHPIVILKDVKFSELKSMMDYMYRGEVNISQDQLGTFLKAAESLQIKGLSDNGDDSRDVGSTAKKPDAPRPSVTQTRAPLESKRPAPVGDLSDTSRDGSISPSSLRKRRRTRRPSNGDDPDSNLDNNICDLPAAQSTPMPVPSAPVPKQIVKSEPPPPMPDPVKKEILDPPAEPLLEPKTEYLDYMNNENSIEVEDLTLDDDDEDGMDSSMDASRPGPSHGDLSQQGGYPPWTMTGDQSGTDEIFMAAQEAVSATGQQRDSQDLSSVAPIEENGVLRRCSNEAKSGDLFEEQVVQLSKELNLMAEGTTTRLRNKCTLEREKEERPVKTMNPSEVNISNNILTDQLFQTDQLEDRNDCNAALPSDQEILDRVVKANTFQPLIKLVPLQIKTENPVYIDKTLEQEIGPASLSEERENTICSKCNGFSSTENHVCSFKCNLCSNTFKSCEELNQHIKRLHKKKKKINSPYVKKKRKNSVFKCNLCSYTAKYSMLVGQHCIKVHENKESCSARAFLTVPKENVFESDTQNSSIEKNMCIESVAQTNHSPRYTQFHSNSNGTTSSVATSFDIDILSHSQYRMGSSSAIRTSCDVDKNVDNILVDSNIIKQEEIDIMDVSSLSADLNPKTISYEDFYSGPLIEDSQTMDEGSWIDMREDSVINNTEETILCSKCNYPHDPCDHECLTKPDDYLINSKLRKKIIVKSENQSNTGKMFKCDLCSYKSRYIQSIGKHKRKIHNITVRVTKEYLLEKRCILKSKFTKLLKCEYCSYTSDYIQNIGVHKSKMHQAEEDRFFKDRLEDTASGETEGSTVMKDTQMKEIEALSTLGENSLIDVGEKSSIDNSEGEGHTCSKCHRAWESNNHVCLFKCTKCPFISTYKKVIVNHELKKHNVNNKSSKQPYENLIVHERKKHQAENDKICNKSVKKETTAGQSNGSKIINNTDKAKESSKKKKIQRKISSGASCHTSCKKDNDDCLFKCDLCCFTSKYKNHINRHKFRNHKKLTKSDNKSILGNLYRCDLCSYKSKYIQAIGNHKKITHNVIGQASKEYLMRKKCIIKSKKVDLFKCEYCPFTSDFIQSIGIHKKIHVTEERNVDYIVKENSKIEPTGLKE